MKNPCRDIMVGLMFVMAAIAPPTRDIARAGDDPATYPTRAIHVVVGFTPGGGNDLIARIVGRKLSENLGQPVIIDNKPGAGAIVATEYVAKAPPDGYTLLVGATGAMTINPAVYTKLSYDTVRDFAPISMIASFPLLLTVNSAAPARTVAELVAYAKANPAKANYASSSAAFQLATELFKMKTGAPLEHIAYKSSGEMLLGVVSGNAAMAIIDPPPTTVQVQAGKLRALAVTGAMRTRELPDVPTLGEAGVPGVVVGLWSGFFVPTGTPKPIIDRLSHELREVILNTTVRDQLIGMAVNPAGNSPEEFRHLIAAEISMWQAVVKEGNLKFSE